jgi:multidrug transporter EmrE-like cation transporter
VKVLLGSISHEIDNGYASAVFMLLATTRTALLQIICLNRSVKVYESTLVVLVFYGVYTAVGYVRRLSGYAK